MNPGQPFALLVGFDYRRRDVDAVEFQVGKGDLDVAEEAAGRTAAIDQTRTLGRIPHLIQLLRDQCQQNFIGLAGGLEKLLLVFQIKRHPFQIRGVVEIALVVAHRVVTFNSKKAGSKIVAAAPSPGGPSIHRRHQ